MSPGGGLLDQLAPRPRGRVSRCRVMAASRQQLLAGVATLTVERTLDPTATDDWKRARRFVLGRLAPEVRRAPSFTLPLRFGATFVAVRPLQVVVVGRAVRGAATRQILAGHGRQAHIVGAFRLDSLRDGVGTNVCVELRIVGSGLTGRIAGLCLRPLLSLAGAAAGRWLAALDRAVVTSPAGGPKAGW